MVVNMSGRATAIAALIVLVLAISTTAAPPYFGGQKNEKDECVLLCNNQYLCACFALDPNRRNQCCQDYCQQKCGSGGIGECGDLPKRPKC
ncbi:hypothetical protein ACS0TY_026967 [Phlomoides rotata]